MVSGRARQSGGMAPHPALSDAAQASRTGFRLRIPPLICVSGGRVSGETQLSAERADSGGVSRRNLRQRGRIMLVDVKVPVLSESVAEATLLSWHKKEGEQVDRDQNLIDVETDKVVLELPAPATGVLTKIIKGDGTTVAGGEIIATIDTEAAATEAEAVPTGREAAPVDAKVTA